MLRGVDFLPAGFPPSLARSILYIDVYYPASAQLHMYSRCSPLALKTTYTVKNAMQTDTTEDPLPAVRNVVEGKSRQIPAEY